MTRSEALRLAPDPGLARVRTAQVAHDEAGAVPRLAEALGRDLAFVALFVTPLADFAAIMAEAARIYPDSVVVGCTTAGELGAGGYVEGAIVALGLPRGNFVAVPVLVPNLDDLDSELLVGDMIRARTALVATEPRWTNEFAFLVVDGLSVREDELVSTLAAGLGPVPLFGGSAGDGSHFRETYVALGGEVMRHAAVACMIRTDCEVQVFTLNHLRPSGTRMVVTEAEPTRRIVRQINAEPAAREYARVLGKDPEDLTALTFAAHPVVVRFGGAHHVRAIQRVLDNGDLVFFSAIDEGLVLTLAEPDNMAEHLEQELARIRRGREPEAIWACDCILRRLEAEQTQQTRALSSILSKNRVVGFSTYGEQINGMHVNQTMTGVAIFPPSGDA
ncbi:FIST N-terminal domain-containing protein [Rubellimicrobium roseum]|uniref:GfdT protein n=1 Tax=Rubellimicrobium roseum TaxID=687525 RepID=A0A5C4NCW6_9RHOB|nr:FIST N-terminal domain-containing protein [Rubellimicrobium roseum]TNC66831.1 GfdT protein [Rubellimicrobium roseum]